MILEKLSKTSQLFVNWRQRYSGGNAILYSSHLVETFWIICRCIFSKNLKQVLLSSNWVLLVNCLFFHRYRARDGPQSGEQAQVYLHHQTQSAAPPLVRSHAALIRKKWQPSWIFIYFAADRHGPNSVVRTCECLEGVSSREFAFLTHLLMITACLFSKLHFVKLQPANQLPKPHPNSKHVRSATDPKALRRVTSRLTFASLSSSVSPSRIKR